MAGDAPGPAQETGRRPDGPDGTRRADRPPRADGPAGTSAPGTVWWVPVLGFLAGGGLLFFGLGHGVPERYEPYADWRFDAPGAYAACTAAGGQQPLVAYGPGAPLGWIDAPQVLDRFGVAVGLRGLEWLDPAASLRWTLYGNGTANILLLPDATAGTPAAAVEESAARLAEALDRPVLPHREGVWRAEPAGPPTDLVARLPHVEDPAGMPGHLSGEAGQWRFDVGVPSCTWETGNGTLALDSRGHGRLAPVALAKAQARDAVGAGLEAFGFTGAWSGLRPAPGQAALRPEWAV